MAKMFLLLFVIFVSSQGFLLDGNTQTERRSRSKLEAALTQELQALRQEIAKCQCGTGNGGHSQLSNQGSLTNAKKALKDEIIHLKRDHELLKTEIVGLIQNNTILKDKLALLERNLTTIHYKQCDFNLRSETSHLEIALQITNSKLNAVINNANARKQDFIALFQKVQSTEQRLENSTRSLGASQNTTFVKQQKAIINGDQRLQNKTETMEANQNTTYRKIKQEYSHNVEISKCLKTVTIMLIVAFSCFPQRGR